MWSVCHTGPIGTASMDTIRSVARPRLARVASKFIAHARRVRDVTDDARRGDGIFQRNGHFYTLGHLLPVKYLPETSFRSLRAPMQLRTNRSEHVFRDYRTIISSIHSLPFSIYTPWRDIMGRQRADFNLFTWPADEV